MGGVCQIGQREIFNYFFKKLGFYEMLVVNCSFISQLFIYY